MDERQQRGEAARETGDGEVLIRRMFDAPRETIFELWSSQEHLARWYAPQGCSIQFPQFEFRVGGAFVSRLRLPDGDDCWCRGTYLELVPGERIVFSLALCDESGEAVDSADVGKGQDWPSETVVTVTFQEQAGGTEMVLRQSVRESIAKRTGAYGGWLEMLDRLGGEVAAQYGRMRS